MSEILFNIVFKGRFSRQVGKEKAVLHFAKIFKLPPAKAEVFFDGKSRVLKKSLPMEKANHIRAMLKKAGLRVTLDKIKSEESESIDDSIRVDKVGAVLVNKPFVAPLHVDTSAMNMDEVGVQIVEKQHIETPEFELDEYVLEEVGAQMDEKKTIIPVEYDLSHLEASEITGQLEQKDKVTPKEYDLDSITLNEVGTQMDKKKDVPPPQFDLDKIKLEES